MSNYSVLKQDINNNIYENQTQQITGTVLNAILNEMTNALGAGYQFAGVATLGMNPGDPDQRVFYLAGEGVYTNFGGIQVPAGKLGVLKWDFRWTLQTIDGLGGGGANLTGYVSLASTDDLPEEGQPTLGYLCGTNLYLYVGTGGDTKEGKYQNCGSFRGPQGLQGDPGVGIASVTQTTTSTEDEGINVITVTKEDGTQSTFQVKNGSKGSQGIQGPQGVQGEPGRLQAQYKEVETLPTASADTVDYIYLVASQTPNTYDMYYTEENQGAYSWKSLGTTAVQLSDYATKAEVTELEHKVYNKIGAIITPFFSLAQGGIASATGLDTVSTTRIRTENYIAAEKIKITTSGNKVYVMGYKEDGTFVSAQGWLTTSQEIAIIGADKYRFVFAYSNDATIVPGDFSSLNISIEADYDSDFAPIEDFSLLEHEADEILSVKKTTVITAPSVTGYATDFRLNYNSGSYESATGYNITAPVTLMKGEIVIARLNMNPGYCALFKTSNSAGHGTRTPLIEGTTGVGVAYYSYTAENDDEYIVFGYKAADGISVYKVTSETIDAIKDGFIEERKFAEFVNGNIPLESGGFSVNGKWANTKRMTTGRINNTRPLFIKFDSSKYECTYVYGDAAPYTDGGYINSDTVIDVNSKYIAFTLVKATDFEEGEYPDLFVVNSVSNTRKTINLLEKTEEAVDDKIQVVEGIRNIANIGRASDSVLVKSAACVSGTTYSNIVPVSFKQGEIIRIKVDTSTGITRYPSLKYDNGDYITDGDPNERYGSWRTFVLSRDTDSILCELYKTFVTESGTITVSIVKVSPLLLREKMFQFMNTKTLTDVQYTIAQATGFDISDNGVLYGAATAATNAYGEYGNPNYKGCLVIANIADPEGTKETKVAAEKGVSGWSGIGLGTIENVFCWTPKVVVADAVNLAMNLVWRDHDDSDIQYHGFVVRGYTPSTDSFSADVVPCDIDVLGTVYPMKSKYNLVDNSWVIDDASKAAIEAIWSATGIEHPARNSGPVYDFSAGANPVKCPYEENGQYYYYVPISLGNESHALCKSLDLIHWIFVCDIPFNQISLEEACVCFANNRVYALSRGQYGADFDNKFGRVMYCDFSKLTERDNSNWSDPVVLHNWRNERPTIAELNGVLYLMGGLGLNATSGGTTIPRGQKCLITMDSDLNILTRDGLSFTYPILHFHLMSWSGQLWFYTSSDKRCFFANKSGDTRNEVSFSRVDENILKM